MANENQEGVKCDLKGNEGDGDQLSSGMNNEDDWTASKLHSSVHVNDLMNNGNEDGYVESYSHSSRKKDSFEKNSVFYLDKSVVECELPELIVCYKENSYHVVKDICIDEGVPTQDKFLFDRHVDKKGLCNSIAPEKDGNGECVKGNMENKDPLQDAIKSALRSHIDRHIGNECNPEELMLTGKVKDDANMETDMPMNDVPKSITENDSDKQKQCDSQDLMVTGKVKDDVVDKTGKDISFTLADVLSIPELEMEKPDTEASNNGSNELEEQSSQIPTGKAILAGPAVVSVVGELNSSSDEVRPALVAAVEASNEGIGGASPLNPILVSVAEKENDGKDNTNLIVLAAEESLVSKVSSKIKGETGSTNVDVDSFASRSSGQKYPQNIDHEHLESKNSRLEDSNSQPVSSRFHNGFGETSFSAAGPVSGLISYSGPIAYSGSLSLRSDSSTTSTRSFAFPVLQSEWNSSPVRMAKADRRHLRKHRGWRRGFLCCRF